jgi:hypothetical protein
MAWRQIKSFAFAVWDQHDFGSSLPTGQARIPSIFDVPCSIFGVHIPHFGRTNVLLKHHFHNYSK